MGRARLGGPGPLVEDIDLDTLAYYRRGLGGELHERLGAGMILGASRLTASSPTPPAPTPCRNSRAPSI